jgi:hypothetical protein
MGKRVIIRQNLAKIRMNEPTVGEKDRAAALFDEQRGRR